jgi:hypothetical protein
MEKEGAEGTGRSMEMEGAEGTGRSMEMEGAEGTGRSMEMDCAAGVVSRPLPSTASVLAMLPVAISNSNEDEEVMI